MKTTINRFKSSFHHTPIEDYRHIFHGVLRAGHYRIAPDFPMQSWSRPGHDLVLGIAGAGAFQVDGRSFTVNTGELCWADCERHDVLWPARSAPWEFLWVRIDSAQLNPLAAALEVESNPIFVPRKTAEAVAIYRNIFRLLRDRPMNMDAALHVQVGALIAVLFAARHNAATGERRELPDVRTMTGLAAVLDTMRLKYPRRWTIPDLARVADISPSQFFRRFRQATGSSPMNWLRRERINQSKRRLGETNDRIRDIAAQVGYSDPLYFSRDFKKLVGVSPRRYRQQEQAAG